MPDLGKIVPITGTVVEVAPDVCGDDVMYPRVVIRKEDGTVREFAPVHAFYEMAGLIEANGADTSSFGSARPNAGWRSSTATGAREQSISNAVREYLELID